MKQTRWLSKFSCPNIPDFTLFLVYDDDEMFSALYIFCIYSNALPVNTMNPNWTAPKGIVWSLGYKTFFMLKSTEHRISTAHKNSNTEK